MVSIGVETTKETGERRGVIQHLDRVLVCAHKRQEERELEQALVGAGARVPVSAPSETSKGSDVKMPQPRKARASKPATPASKRASAAGPPFSYVSLASGASAMYRSIYEQANGTGHAYACLGGGAAGGGLS